MSAPRGLTAEEAEAWDRLTATVAPLHPLPMAPPKAAVTQAPPPPEPLAKALARRAARPGAKAVARTVPKPVPPPPPPSIAAPDRGLDSHWDRRLKSGVLQPELTLDLHGHTLDAAYDRLMGGVAQARAMGARTVLLITGKPRPVAAADRGERRGAIRAKVLDWLAASGHHSAIAAVRRAHPRHGGDGALYIVLRRER